MRSIFLDTNILVYLSNITHPFHAVARQRYGQLVTAEQTRFVLAYNSLREYWAAISKGRRVPLSPADYQRELALLTTLYTLLDDGAVTFPAFQRLTSTYPIQGAQIYDCHIVATMLTHGIASVLTHNVRDFAIFSPEITIIPLQA